MRPYNIIILSGGFDPLHIGHLRMIKAANDMCDAVVVGVNSDAWLTRKKNFVFMPFEERLEIIKSIEGVYRAVGFNDKDDTACQIIQDINSKYTNCSIAFANGGDRNINNVPEISLCESLGVDLLWETGGGKIKSSTRLAENNRPFVGKQSAR